MMIQSSLLSFTNTTVIDDDPSIQFTRYVQKTATKLKQYKKDLDTFSDLQRWLIYVSTGAIDKRFEIQNPPYYHDLRGELTFGVPWTKKNDVVRSFYLYYRLPDNFGEKPVSHK